MLTQRILPNARVICVSCRLHASIAAKQSARSRRNCSKPHVRFFATTLHSLQAPSAIADVEKRQTLEDTALHARQTFGDALPEGYLDREEYRVYERLYGKPLKYDDQTEILQEEVRESNNTDQGTGVLIEASDGALEEVQFEIEESRNQDSDSEAAWNEEIDAVVEDNDDVRLETDTFASADHDVSEDAQSEESNLRAHPLTLAGRFTTFPSTLPIPDSTITSPIESQLSSRSYVHLQQAAHRLFGGIGLPYSTSTPNLAKTLQQRPIPLDASQNQMSEIEGDAFFSTLVPGMYASVMSVLVETRKRLGSAWAEELVRKAERGELRILDAGGAGAGILAVREMLRADWERMHEDDSETGSSTALAEPDGRLGGASGSPPSGHATVLTGSDALRKRASFLLENTTFVPRLPDYAHTTDAKEKGKFDLVIAPHSLWSLSEEYLRRDHMENLWSLLRQDGGVLLLLEKGVARGFENIAAAREFLLEEHIQSLPSISDTEEGEHARAKNLPKERGMIIAPCTNHESCPMFQPRGMLKGRRDICHFSQRYVRPSFLQRILGAKDKNFEDVKFSYLSVMRGKDLRETDSNPEGAIEQNEVATSLAFEGYEATYLDLSPQAQQNLQLSLPRSILPPLKKKGHVIMDLCTPSGTLERWTVPRSFGRQAFRDARKSSWGDIWGLGAKTRVLKAPRARKRRPNAADMDVKLVKKKVGEKRKKKVEMDED